MDATDPTRPGPRHEHHNGTEAVRALAEGLDRVARIVRALLVLRALAWIAAGAVAGVVLLGLIDLGLRLPSPVRGVLLMGGLACLVAAWAALVRPAWRLRPGRAGLAQRIERIDPRHAGQIAPAVDLLDQTEEPGEAGLLARAAVERAGQRVADVDAGRMIRWSGVGGSLVALGAALLVTAGLFAWSAPMSRIGAARVLTPWTDAAWPKRYGVTDLTRTGVHPIDEALPVRVAVGPSDPGSRVRVEWRLGDERTGRTPMTPQPGQTGDGRPFERLIDPAGLARHHAEVDLRYRVITPDDRTAWRRVRLVRPPEVASAASSIEPPEHAAGAPGLAGFRTGDATLATGPASLGPVLEGSRVLVQWRFTSPVTGVDEHAWADQALDIERPDDRTVVVSWDASGPVRITPVVVDEHGLGVRETVSVGVDVRADAAPGVTITRPSSDEIVTPAAALEIAAEAGDDVGVTALRLDATLLRPPGGSPGAGPEPVGEAVRLASASIGQPLAQAEVRVALVPRELNAVPGDEIALRAVARDTRGEAGEARSGERRLRVVSADDLAARLRSELSPLSRLLRRTDEQQAGLAERVRRGEEETGPMVREQIALSDTVASAVRSVRELEQARQRNALDDPALESLLRDLDRTLGEARDAARAAARSMEDEDAEQAHRDQREARDRIGEALSLLDRGEDAFLARRAVSRVREQLAEAREATAEIGRQTAGRDAAELTEAERAELDRLAREQAELADRAREALEELTRRAEALERDDPAQAEALRRAAEQGRAGAVESLIEDAAVQTGENQTGEAGRSQDEALERLDEMLEEIDRAAALRDTALRRRLASLIGSITMLIDAQTLELRRLDLARDAWPEGGLAPAMIALRDNTLGVREEASAAMAELRLIAEMLGEAEAEQAGAVTHLRADPADLDRAEPRERASLSTLERALEEARRQDDQAAERERERRKAELRGAYRDALRDQNQIREQSEPLTGRDLNRRERLDARRIATEQRELADRLVAVREAHAEISDAPVFALAHDRLDDLMRAAADGLNEAAPSPGVAMDQEQAADILAALVDVLGESARGPDQDFQDGAGGGSGQGAGAGQEDLIPPIAELRLLRDMQRGAMDMTRRMGDLPDPGSDPARLARLGDLQRLLAERGTELIEKLNQQPAPSEQVPAEPPAGPPADPPTDSEESPEDGESSNREPGSPDENP
ncbi:MAG: hypothetical protein LAT64_08830 [Phycisphaerales bacterium]|nr:hypothetical protein [Planctomycetota bacterium]MCH8508854.1 hypothetical protein [Phycisphaerales bacterium]